MAWEKQREFPRFKAALPVELRRPGSTTPMRAQTGDICLGGCYVEMSSTEAISREVEVTLWVGGEKVLARGVIVSNHPSFGNGIKFTKVEADSMARLRQFVDSLKPFGR